MPKLLKLSFRLLMLLIFCLVLSIGLLVSFVDPNNYKDQLAAQISQQAGRAFKINKRLSWSFFPGVKIVAEDVSLANRDGFGNAPMLQAEQIGFGVNLLPLLHGQIDINKISVKKAVIQLAINKQGKNNWTKPSQATNENTAAKTKSSGFFKLNRLDVRNMTISHATITLNDQRIPRRTTLIDVNYTGRFSLRDIGGSVGESHVASPLYILRQLNVVGRLRAGALTVNKFKARDLKADINVLNDKLTIKPISIDLYDGRYDGQVMVDVSGAAPSMQFNQAITRLNLAALFSDLVSQKKITGTLQANMQLHSKNITQLPRSLQGKANIIVADGEIQGIDLSHTIALATAFALRESLPQGSAKNSTPFKTMTGAVLIENGVIKNDNFSLDSPVLSIAGRGFADLNTQQISGELNAKLLGPLRRKTYLDIEKILGGSIPLVLAGKFSDFSVKPNYKIIGKSAFESLLKSKAGDKIKKTLDDALQGIFRKPAQ